MKKLTILVGLAMALALALPGSADAATFTVDSTADAPDANPGDGVCDDGAGNCTLRAAIEEANALAGADTITLPAGSYALTGGELDITDDLTITGAGPATTFVDGGLVARVFRISSATVEISGVTIQNGATGSLGGGGILNDGTMTLTNVTVSGNSASEDGGGIFNNGTMTLTDVTVSGNSTTTTVSNISSGVPNAAATLTLTH
ncbi:MAG: CSLREA domain-containing protein, partial [Chloroflexi bacterium]|nr:CSLREA domain-containing protein [Chloroflexota bacterium]